MCWDGLNKPIVAEEDIKVFKICLKQTGKTLMSYFRTFVYEVGVEYSATFGIEIEDFGEIAIYEGLHSYSTECPIKFDTYIGKNRFIDYYPPNESIVKVECVIPKGATYYENENGEIVSDTLRIVSCSTLPNNVYVFVQRKECISPEWRE